MSRDPLHWLEDELSSLAARQLLRRLAVRESAQRGEELQFAGRTLHNFGANDYLGLAADVRVIAAAHNAMQQQGWGAGASPLVTGRGSYHAQLETALAEFEGTECALLFPTGYAANVGTITALVSAGDIVFSDAKNHASIIDGCRLSGAKIHIYPHNDITALSVALQESHACFRRRLIATDSLFSMDGDFANLPALAQLAEEHAAMLVIDEAHATGVFGEQGRGVCELLAAEQSSHIRIGTLSKALGSHGGFVAGSRSLIDYLANRARPYIYSTAAPEAASAAALAALQIVREEPQRRVELQARAERFRARLRSEDWSIGATQSQIVPVIVGDPGATLRVSAALREAGFFVPGIRPPSVPIGESLLRISLSWHHSESLLASLAEALQRSAK